MKYVISLASLIALWFVPSEALAQWSSSSSQRSISVQRSRSVNVSTPHAQIIVAPQRFHAVEQFQTQQVPVRVREFQTETRQVPVQRVVTELKEVQVQVPVDRIELREVQVQQVQVQSAKIQQVKVQQVQVKSRQRIFSRQRSNDYDYNNSSSRSTLRIRGGG